MSAKISAIKNWNIPDKSQLLSGCKEIEMASAASTGSNKLAAFGQLVTFMLAHLAKSAFDGR